MMKKRILTLVAAMLLTLLPAYAQLDWQSVDPVADSIAIAAMRYRMDRIRKHRPTVALVLSGGGAKGAAHVGALKYLEEVGIPIDMVLGTSMGGLIGGLYSLGYSPTFLDSLLRSVDWTQIMSDKVPSELTSYQDRKYKEKYVLGIPFYYSKDGLFNRRTEDRTFPDADGSLHLGANDELADKSLKENLFGSLPSGYIYGQNVSNVFSGLTVGYQDSIDFATLPIPFFCVAAELVTGKAKLWTSGKLNTALRSTMSIPGVFAPVRTDGMILVDGGIRNNFPTDVAKAMGADIVIGVELSGASSTYSDINNIADLASQIIDMMVHDSFVQTLSIPDVTIKPDLAGFTTLSFDPVSVDTIISRGYQASIAQADKIAEIKRRVGPETVEFNNSPAVDIGEIPIVLSGIQFEGATPAEINYLLKKIDIKVGDKVRKSDIEKAVATIYATRSFDYVNYEVYRDAADFILSIKCKKGPVHQAGIGVRFDSETMVSALVNVGLNVHKVEGASFDFTARIGANPYLDIHYLYKMAATPTLHIDLMNALSDVDLFSIGSSPWLNMSYWRFSQKAYLSDINWRSANVQAGIRNDFFNVLSLLSMDYIPADYDIKSLTDDYLTVFCNLRKDSWDDGYFPTRGIKAGLSYDWLLGSLMGEVPQNHIFTADVSKVFSFGRSVAFIPSLYARCSLGDALPVAFMNVAGGSLAGRYIEQQVPFIGINYATPFESKMLLARADLRVRLSSNNYITLIANALKDSKSFDSDLLLTGNTAFGCALEWGYDSIGGPIKANIHWSNITHSVGAYLSLGFDF